MSNWIHTFLFFSFLFSNHSMTESVFFDCLSFVFSQSKNYRNYRVKTNAYIENLNYWENLQQNFQKLQVENEHTPLNYLQPQSNQSTTASHHQLRSTFAGGHAGNINKAKNNRFWKCDYCLCGCYPKWQPCGCACSHHKKEDCPHPDLTKVKPTETRSYRRQLTNKRCQDSGSQAHQTDKILKCDHDICEYPPEWKPRDRECSVHRKGNCSHPDPAKLGAHEKRKTEPQQNRTRDVSPSRDLINASVPPKYDTRKQIELVLHRRAEATSQETSNHQTSSLLSDVMEDEERRTRIEEENINITINDLNHCGPNTRVTGKSQNTTHTESIRDQQCPANSTTSTATGSHKQWDIDYMSMLGNSLCSTTHAKEKLPVKTSSNKARQITTQDNPSHMRRY